MKRLAAVIYENVDIDKTIESIDRMIERVENADSEHAADVEELNKQLGNHFLTFFMKYCYRGFSRN